MADDPVAEWSRCGHLRQAHIDRLLAAGVPVMALAQAWWGGLCLVYDAVVARDGRFEFARYSDPSEAQGAFLALAFDRWGEPADLVAFRGGADGFVASWLGRVGLLGEEQLDMARIEPALKVHADPLSWLKAERDGVVIVDPVRAAPMLREVGPLAVTSYEERRRLERIITPQMPRIIVSDQHRAAA